MELLKIFIGVILPYVAVAVFVAGMAYRINTWKKLPSPPMTLFPAPRDAQANTVNTVQEAFLFRSLFKGDRLLWLIAWSFHAVLALIFLGHIRVFTNADGLLMSFGLSTEQIQAMSSGVGGAAGVVILLTAVMLLTRRLVVSRVREISGLGDYLALALIGAIILTGNAMRFSPDHFDLALTREYFAGLATFQNVTQVAALEHSQFLLHMFLALMLVIIIPFSKILHFGGIFFTHQMIRKH